MRANLSELKAELLAEGVLSGALLEASGHKYNCRCSECLDWWVSVGSDDHELGSGDAPRFGPFMEEEVTNRAREIGVEAWWAPKSD